MACHFASKSNVKCVAYPPPQTLDELDMASMKIPGKHMKISWLILSRVGIHYLSSTFGSWTICQTHRKEFLDAWQVSNKCSHPDHNIFDESSIADNLVTMVMSVKLLQNEGKVVPISSKFCKNCFDDFNRAYTSKPGEKVVVIVPKPKPQSPFCPAKPVAEKEPISAGNGDVMHNIKSRGVLATSKPPEPPSHKSNDLIDEINIKTELIFEDTDNGNNNFQPQPTTEKRSPVVEQPQPQQQRVLPQPAEIPAIQSSITMTARPLARKVLRQSERTPAIPSSATATPSTTRGTRSKKVSQKSQPQEVQDEIEDEDEILSHDSDDDPSWAPNEKDRNKEQEKEVNNLIQGTLHIS